MDELERRDFIRRQPTSGVITDREYIFKHVLTREVAYGTLPRAGRRERHRVIAAFIERESGDRVGNPPRSSRTTTARPATT